MNNNCKRSNIQVTQKTGQSIKEVMSQKAVTDLINGLNEENKSNMEILGNKVDGINANVEHIDNDLHHIDNDLHEINNGTTNINNSINTMNTDVVDAINAMSSKLDNLNVGGSFQLEAIETPDKKISLKDKAGITFTNTEGDLNITGMEVPNAAVINFKLSNKYKKGVANGIPELDSNGRIPASQLPSGYGNSDGGTVSTPAFDTLKWQDNSVADSPSIKVIKASEQANMLEVANGEGIKFTIDGAFGIELDNTYHKGIPNGIASLDSTGRVPISQNSAFNAIHLKNDDGAISACDVDYVLDINEKEGISIDVLGNSLNIGVSEKYKKGVPDGVAPLNSNGKIDSSYLPTNIGGTGDTGGTSTPAFTKVEVGNQSFEASSDTTIRFEGSAAVKVSASESNKVVVDVTDGYKKGVANGIVPLNENTKINSDYVEAFKTIRTDDEEINASKAPGFDLSGGNGISTRTEGDHIIVIDLDVDTMPDKYKKGADNGIVPLENGIIPAKYKTSYSSYEWQEIRGITGDYPDVIDIYDFREGTITIEDEGWKLGMTKTIYVSTDSSSNEEITLTSQLSIFKDSDVDLMVSSKTCFKFVVCKGSQGFYVECTKLTSDK